MKLKPMILALILSFIGCSFSCSNQQDDTKNATTSIDHQLEETKSQNDSKSDSVIVFIDGKENTIEEKKIIGDKLIIIFMADFADTLTIKFDDSLITKAYFVTNASIGASDRMVKLRKPKKKGLLKVIPNNGNILKVEVNNQKNYLYISRFSGFWHYEFRDIPLELE